MFALKCMNVLLLCLQLSQILADPVPFGVSRIESGDPIPTPTEYYQVYITNAQGKTFCTGALLHPEWVLTSAVCAAPFQASSLRVATGQKEHTSAITNLKFVFRVIKHPNYRASTLANDLALLYIEAANEPLTTPIPLPSQPQRTYYNKWADVSGYGDKAQGTPSTEILTKHVQIVSNAACRKMLYPTPINYKICASGTTLCKGDQGSPLVLNGELIGIASAGSDALLCSQSYTAQFTNVAMYLNWIGKYVYV